MRPYIQVQGWVNEDVRTVTYSIANASGTSSGSAAIVDQVFDPSKCEFTTDYFQAYDVGLAEGTNLITLVACDLAGNLATNSFAVQLDYTLATNAPALQVSWPPANTPLCGENFYIRGHISDETATLLALWVDPEGETNILDGIVERNGAFWIENLSLNAGTNSVQLIARDAAGNSTQTDVQIVKSDLILTVFSRPTGDSLYDPSGTVTGTVSAPGCTVSVNGVSVQCDESGYFLAEQVPIYGEGTATFDLIATPGGGAPAAALSIEEEKPAKLIITDHVLTQHITSPSYNETYTKIFSARLAPQPNGQWATTYSGKA